MQHSLEAATTLATERLRSENAALVNALANRTAETLAAVDGARRTLSENVDDVIGRLSASSAQLGNLVESAKSNLVAVDEKLSGTTDKFAATTDKAAQTFASSARLIDANTNRLTELSQAALREVAAIANRFDEHGRLLANASNLIGAAQSNFEHTLERQSSLEDLAVGLVKKSEDLERVMKSFEDLVGNGAGKGRRPDAGIDRQDPHLDHRGRGVGDQALCRSDRGDAPDGGVDQERARGYARRVEEGRNRHAGRGQGIDHGDPPRRQRADQCAEGTVGHRRQVGPHVRCFRSQHAAPGRRLRRRPRLSRRRARTAAAARGAARRGAARRRRPSPRRAARSTWSARPRPIRRATAPHSRSRPAGCATCCVALPARRTKLRPSRLDRSRRAGQRSPIHVVESLNSLSVDIARAIDHEASIELWDRYRRGERDVFTRRLYTLKGQQTFDEIRRKYQNDAEFRAAVDRYCDDFEKLLKDITRNDRDNIMTQTYLTSDTGKVYTMLAHAAGRLR